MWFHLTALNINVTARQVLEFGSAELMKAFKKIKPDTSQHQAST